MVEHQYLLFLSKLFPYLNSFWEIANQWESDTWCSTVTDSIQTQNPATFIASLHVHTVPSNMGG